MKDGQGRERSRNHGKGKLGGESTKSVLVEILKQQGGTEFQTERAARTEGRRR